MSLYIYFQLLGDAEGVGSVPGSGKPPGGGNGNPLQYACLENSMTEDPGGLQSMVLQRVTHALQLCQKGS